MGIRGLAALAEAWVRWARPESRTGDARGVVQWAARAYRRRNRNESARGGPRAKPPVTLDTALDTARA